MSKRLKVAGAIAIALALAAVTAGSVARAGGGSATAIKGAKGCHLNGHGSEIKHVIYLQFDNTPAPWVPWARAGCDVGNVSTANAVLENNNSIVFRASPAPATLAAPASPGDTNVKVNSVNGLAAGQTVVIQRSNVAAEFNTIAHVGTAGAVGTGVDLTAPLTNAHGTGAAFTVYTLDPTGDMTKVLGEGSPERIEGRNDQ